ncbi:hypothetical protein K431DRAFT_315245 [Polychaeton citri CBS 116435]|uniref:Myb-like domain-containing protein n=1 Tax=Polychaeton citri CBS 116435 TaxID=1314669 RepID=A0A9P4Q4M6_9PEZI|nr:hypothetical protein K431DRAFT_315245 [Polychaeton citri CBS 116435]
MAALTSSLNKRGYYKPGDDDDLYDSVTYSHYNAQKKRKVAEVIDLISEDENYKPPTRTSKAAKLTTASRQSLPKPHKSAKQANKAQSPVTSTYREANADTRGRLLDSFRSVYEPQRIADRHPELICSSSAGKAGSNDEPFHKDESLSHSLKKRLVTNSTASLVQATEPLVVPQETTRQVAASPRIFKADEERLDPVKFEDNEGNISRISSTGKEEDDDIQKREERRLLSMQLRLKAKQKRVKTISDRIRFNPSGAAQQRDKDQSQSLRDTEHNGFPENMELRRTMQHGSGVIKLDQTAGRSDPVALQRPSLRDGSIANIMTQRTILSDENIQLYKASTKPRFTSKPFSYSKQDAHLPAEKISDKINSGKSTALPEEQRTLQKQNMRKDHPKVATQLSTAGHVPHPQSKPLIARQKGIANLIASATTGGSSVPVLRHHEQQSPNINTAARGSSEIADESFSIAKVSPHDRQPAAQDGSNSSIASQQQPVVQGTSTAANSIRHDVIRKKQERNARNRAESFEISSMESESEPDRTALPAPPPPRPPRPIAVASPPPSPSPFTENLPEGLDAGIPRLERRRGQKNQFGMHRSCQSNLTRSHLDTSAARDTRVRSLKPHTVTLNASTWKDPIRGKDLANSKPVLSHPSQRLSVVKYPAHPVDQIDSHRSHGRRLGKLTAEDASLILWATATSDWNYVATKFSLTFGQQRAAKTLRNRFKKLSLALQLQAIPVRENEVLELAADGDVEALKELNRSVHGEVPDIETVCHSNRVPVIGDIKRSTAYYAGTPASRSSFNSPCAAESASHTGPAIRARPSVSDQPHSTYDLCSEALTVATDSQLRPTVGGKKIDYNALLQAYLTQDTQPTDIEELEANPPNTAFPKSPSPITDEDYCHFAYQVEKLELPHYYPSASSSPTPNPTPAWHLLSPTFTHPSPANTHAAKAATYPTTFPTAGLLDSYTLSSTHDINGLAEVTFTCPGRGEVRTRVRRVMRTFYDGIKPSVAKYDWVDRTGYVVKEQTFLPKDSQELDPLFEEDVKDDGKEWTRKGGETMVGESIYTVSALANSRAMERYIAVTVRCDGNLSRWDAEKRAARNELEDEYGDNGNDGEAARLFGKEGPLATGVGKGGKRAKVRVWVVKVKLEGPRNL